MIQCLIEALWIRQQRERAVVFSLARVVLTVFAAMVVSGLEVGRIAVTITSL